MVHSICGYTCEWQVKLCDPSLTRAISERFRDESYKSTYTLLFTIINAETSGTALSDSVKFSCYKI